MFFFYLDCTPPFEIDVYTNGQTNLPKKGADILTTDPSQGLYQRKYVKKLKQLFNFKIFLGTCLEWKQLPCTG